MPSLSGLLIFPFSILFSGIVLEYTIIIAVVFLLVSILFHHHHSFRKYWQIIFAFFIAALALLLDLLVNIPPDTISRLLLDMLASTSIIVSVIILLTKASGTSLSLIFLKKGKIKTGAIVGVGGFLIFAIASIPLSVSLFGGQNLTFARIVSWIPWIIPVVFLNGLREELLYRGLFLKKYEVALGAKLLTFFRR